MAQRNVQRFLLALALILAVALITRYYLRGNIYQDGHLRAGNYPQIWYGTGVELTLPLSTSLPSLQPASSQLTRTTTMKQKPSTSTGKVETRHNVNVPENHNSELPDTSESSKVEVKDQPDITNTETHSNPISPNEIDSAVKTIENKAVVNDIKDNTKSEPPEEVYDSIKSGSESYTEANSKEGTKTKQVADTSPQEESSSKNESALKSNCKVKHFIMTKIEKTGSSTLFAIFARFVRNNNLNILIQTHDYHINWRSDRGKGWDIGPGKVEKADVLINHAQYNEQIFEKHMLGDCKIIAPIRQADSWFKSAIKYFGWVTKKPPEQVIFDNATLYKRRESPMEIKSWFHIPQLQWLGFDYEQRDNITAMKEYIDYIVPKIHMPILSDHLAASLLLLKKRFCWEYTDIFFSSYEVRNSKTLTLSNEARQRLLSAEVNLGDQLLYEALNKTWWSHPEVSEEKFWKEVVYFKETNHQVSSVWCPKVKSTNVSYIIPANQWHPPVTITKILCEYLSLGKGPIVKGTRAYALGPSFG